MIANIQSSKFDCVDQVDIDSMTIYPIIVFVDSSFNLEGINYVLNKELKNQLFNQKVDLRNIKDLILIDLDTLIKLQDFFREGKLNLNSCLTEFTNYVSKPDGTNKIVSFRNFTLQRKEMMDELAPKIWLEEANKLIKKAPSNEH